MKKGIQIGGILMIIVLFFTGEIKAQDKTKVSLRDSLDNQLDLSDVIINKKGFVPMPILITEPALGGFGGGLAPIFIQPNKPKVVGDKVYPMSPDITALFGGYTLNDTWAVGGGRSGSIPKWGIRYAIGGGYANVNMDYYFNFTKINQDVDFEFNIRTIPIYASISKQLKDPRFSIGLEYLYLHSDLKIVDENGNGEWRQKLDDKIEDYMSGDIGKLGIKASFDNRDNVFTPNKGFKINVNADWSHPAFGSDYKFGQFEEAIYWYHPIAYNWINGFRFDMQQVAGNQPFYIKPYIDMRGVPTARYQGKYTMLAELEERWDFTRRWSLVFFGGGGKGFDSFDDFGSTDWAYSYGAGFRYLMARKLKLRMGVDFAMGPEGFTYYLVFGSSWFRQ